MCIMCFFFFKQKTAYERRISDWSSDVCSSDLRFPGRSELPTIREVGTGRQRKIFISEHFRTTRWNLKPLASPKSRETANFFSRLRQKMKICGGWRPPGGPRAGPYWIHASRAGEARSRHTQAVVPGRLPGTQCPSRLRVDPLKGEAFEAGSGPHEPT